MYDQLWLAWIMFTGYVPQVTVILQHKVVIIAMISLLIKMPQPAGWGLEVISGEVLLAQPAFG